MHRQLNRLIVAFTCLFGCAAAANNSAYIEDFDALWAAMDQHYPYFDLKGVDWQALGDSRRVEAAMAQSPKAFGQVLQRMLAQLDDLHVFLMMPDGQRINTATSSYTPNWNDVVVRRDLRLVREFGRYAYMGVTREDDFATLVITDQSAATPQLVKDVAKQIEEWRDKPGFLVDLRRAFGGNELLARDVAQAFCADPIVYAKHTYRSGSGHSEFGPVLERVLPASKSSYLGPIVCLQGNGAISSGESFVQMFQALPNAITVGGTTRGASGNPQPETLPNTGIEVWFSRWFDMTVDEHPVEGRGVPPDHMLKASPDMFRAGDPIWDAAQEKLRNLRVTTR